jgi:hypothetical protein
MQRLGIPLFEKKSVLSSVHPVGFVVGAKNCINIYPPHFYLYYTNNKLMRI